MLIGLLYAAPKGPLCRPRPWRRPRRWASTTAIYDHFPINFKVFDKPGTLADGYRRWLQPAAAHDPRAVGDQPPVGRLGGADARHLVPVRSRPCQSLGLCDHAPWIDEVVDFDQLKQFKGEFYMNAYCIDERKDAHLRQARDHARIISAPRWLFR